MDADDFRRLGHALVEWIAAYREGIESRPVMSRVRPGEIRSQLPPEPPATGGCAGELVELLLRLR